MELTRTTAFHDLNEPLAAKLRSTGLADTWNDLTDIQRNEWVCYTTNAKKQKTIDKRLDRAIEDLSAGKKTPCCWPGCPHRRPKAANWFK